MAVLSLSSLAKKQTILSASVAGPAVDEYLVSAALSGSSMYFECLLWEASPSAGLSTQYPSVPSQDYDWAAAPEWASWAAFDEDGFGHWFKSRPVLDDSAGKWRSGPTEKRSWPIYGGVALTRGWRASLGYRPVSAETASTSSSAIPCNCPTSADTVITDVTGYIATTMGEAQLLPAECYSYSDTSSLACSTSSYSADVQENRGAIVLLQESSDGIDWISFGRSVLTYVNSPVYFSYTPTRARIRAVIASIWGQETFATVTVSSPVQL